MNKIEFGDCREIMKRWKDQGIKARTCVTSPPYFGLRDYGVDGQIGLEQTPEDYIKNMVDVFRCVRDVLTDDGTVWLNIGDSYAGSGKGANADGSFSAGALQRTSKGTIQGKLVKTRKIENCKPKDLIGIPWMLAFALRADGWYLRQDIIWQKPNPMPESVKDRCTKAHEYIFLLSKSSKYYFDSDAIKEENADPSRKNFTPGKRSYSEGNTEQCPGNRSRRNDGFQKYAEGASFEGRNKRSVWTVTTKPYRGSHYATYPPELILPCILAGSAKGDIVLDPFMGSGTTAMVAKRNDRQYIGCELNTDYAKLQEERINSVDEEIRPIDLSNLFE